MENSHLVNFGEISSITLYSLGPDFGATLKIQKKFNFDLNQLKVPTQHKYIFLHSDITIQTIIMM